MKRLNLLLAVLALLSSSTMVSCVSTTAAEGEGRASGISASDTATFNRQNVYQMQDRTFRSLAY